jgi:integrase
MIATYGLRACDVVALTLEDVAWRARRIRIQQRKTGPTALVAADEVATHCWNTCAEVGRISE